MYHIKQLRSFPPPYGGVSVYVKRLTERLTSDGYIVGAYYTEDPDGKLEKSVLYDKWQYDASKNLFLRGIEHIKRIIRTGKQVSNYSIVHSHDSFQSMDLLLYLFLVKRKHIIITIHNSMIEDFYHKSFWLYRSFIKFMAGADVQWITVSEESYNALKKLPLKFKNEIPIIPAYIPIKNESPEPLPSNMLDYVKNHEMIMTFYGQSFMIFKNKDVYGFKDSIRLYSDIKKLYDKKIGFVIVIAVVDNQDKLDELYQFAESLGVKDDIYWQIGALSSLQSLWKVTDAYIRPTATDGDSVAVREAIDFGVQVVVSNVCKRPEKSLVYNYSSYSDLLDKTQMAISMGKRSEKLDYSYYYKMKAIYENILNRKGL